MGTSFPDKLEDFTGGRMTAGDLLGEDDGAVHIDFEDTTRGLHETHLSLGKGLFQLGGQTGRPGLIVSDDAILDGYAHGSPVRENPPIRWGES